ncbi:MAG: 23S rRNA (pseudouridine(1915)-N(3))-methyltransferase RlmH [Clostridia bacterium]|nr:23S rRNA (pseudouridine(1915)-N(3))-methyltransferase RlmH [Clostridia bacterium]
MVKGYVTLLTVGNLKESYLVSALAEYKKRISAYMRIEEIELKEERLAEETPACIHAALEAEGDKILAKIPPDAYVVALCVEGKELDSLALADKIAEAGQKSGKIWFIIGSSYGLSPRVKARADLRLSVSKLTFPHQLMRVILAEALYRSLTILAGKKYHK